MFLVSRVEKISKISWMNLKHDLQNIVTEILKNAHYVHEIIKMFTHNISTLFLCVVPIE